MKTRGTALIYDEEMTKYKLLWIEVPERLTVSHEALVKSGLADRCVSVPVREATDADILLVHSEEYLEAVKKTPYMTLEDLKEFTLQYGDVYFHPNIYHCAKLAAGAALQLVDSVMTGKVRNGMALVRPPGHHSMRSAANGFCVFNNVAIAAQYAKQKYGVKRVLIVDWDVHHGQGVQYCFEDDPSVLYFSWHRYEHQKFWPNLRESDYDSVGKEKGAGFNINVPWNKVGMKNGDYLSVFCHVLLPVAYEFCPDLVLVCAGFDSAIGDPELPTSDISTKRLKLAEEEEERLEKVEEEESAEEEAWPEPPKRVAPPIRTALLLPDDVACPDGCKRFSSSDDPNPAIVNKLRETFLKDGDDSDTLNTLSCLTALVDNMAKNEICSGLALVRDVSMAMMCVVQHAAAALSNRKTLLVQFSNKQSEEHECKYSIPVCLKKGCRDVSGFTQAVLGLLLPLAYEYDPSLVLLLRMPDSGLCDGVWQQLTGLLQGLAQGHTLVLMQEDEKACVAPTASSLLGDPAPSLGQLHAPLPEDAEALERLRHRLQTDWKLLQTAVSDLQEEGKNAINAPMLPSGTDIHPEDTLMEENAERIMLDPTSRENLKFKDLLKVVLIDWINSELEEDRIIVKDLEEDCYDGQVLQKLFEKLSGRKLNVAEVTQSEIGQKQKLQTVLEAVNELLRPHGWTIEWSVDSIHSKNLVAIVYLLVALAMHFQAPIRLPEHVSVQVVIVKKREGILQTALVTKELTSTTEMMMGRFERDAFDTLLDHAPDKLNVVKTSLITFVNKHLNKLNLEVTELESQFADGVYLVLLMGLLEDYFVPLYNFFLTPENFEQKVHNVQFAFELMQDGGLKKPKARPEGIL
ncbi:Beta-parvin [Nibea albiflora]|uniref:Beta-parvin n=1 Tax=Nibea albiflora TaxID=240163 RepID=A0ACB7FFM8_NIBAL|nr:Beta-parvin [Nibea albiflora]